MDPQYHMHPLLKSFLSHSSSLEASTEQNADQPNYWTADPNSLLTTSNIHSIDLATGNRILASILPALEAAETEVIFVTCYWAASESLDRICDSLRKLSSKALAAGGRTIRVRICFSSSGLLQKLCHTQSAAGKVYEPGEWSRALGLPGPDELRGLDLQVKSVFLLPISIIHPKFAVVDRKTAFLPSCNVSWEEWFEGCLELGGPVVGQFVRFWEEFWTDARDRELSNTTSAPSSEAAAGCTESTDRVGVLYHHDFAATAAVQSVQTLFLPSPHHRNPRLTLPWQAAAPAPSTPLNIFLLQALESARSHIYIQTPNVTSQPAIAALLRALERGVSVSIVTSERLQLLEQIVTAGTTSPRCVSKLIARHQALANNSRGEDVEDTAALRLGRLKVSYYKPRDGQEASHDEPVQSHFKLTIVDGEVAVFGSGNMDRPSWYTSQELGVAFFDRSFVGKVEEGLEEALSGRRKLAYDG